MTDKQFAVSGEWALASDGNQWILQFFNGQWRNLSFVRSTKEILARCMREKSGTPYNGNLPPCLQTLLEPLPETFNEWAGLEPLNFPKPAIRQVKIARLPHRIVADAKYPNMYRIKLPNGSLSDMVNLTRALNYLA